MGTNIASLNWATISNFFKRGQRRKLEAQVRLNAAYRNTFSTTDGQITLADLANKSGFYRVTDAKYATDRELWQQEGKRLLFAEVFDALSMSEADKRELERAARREAAVDNDPLEQGTDNDDQ